jgi:hypothetical protein
MELVVIVLLILLLSIAALKWGANSCDGINSVEWERRKYFMLGERSRL